MKDLFQCTCPTCGQPMQEQAPDARFEMFWDSWPSRVGRAKAFKAWGKLDPAARSLAVDRARGWFDWWRKQNHDASPIHASTYLNQRRWEDETGGPTIDNGKKLAFYADWVNGEKPLYNSVSASIARELVAAKLVTQQRINERMGT